MRYFVGLVVGLFGAVFLEPCALAQEEPADSGSETVVVTANKYPLPLDELPSAVTVIERAQIEASPVNTVAELLATTAGVHFYDLNANGTSPVTDLRGFNSVGETSYLLVSIDGIPVNELDTDGIDWTRIALSDVERIELLRGPVSAQYGNIGMAGVVNIVTADTPDGFDARAATGAGSYGARSTRFGLGHGDSRARVSFRAERSSLDGWRENSGFDQTLITAMVRPRIKQWADGRSLTTRLSAGFQDSERGDPGAVLQGQDPRRSFAPNDRNDARRLRLDAGAEWRLSETRTIDVDARWQDKSQEVVKTIFGQTPLHQLETASAGLGLRYRQPLGRARLLLGLEGERGSLDSRYDLRSPITVRNTAQSTRQSVAAFGWLDTPLSPRWSVTTALRYDRIDGDLNRASVLSTSTRKTAMSPSVAINWRFTSGGNAWFSWSKSFKAPTMEQLFDLRPYVFFDPDSGEFFPQVLSNAAIEPLRAKNVEIGLRAPLAQRYIVDVVLYHSDVTNEVGFDAASFKFANIAASIHRGFECNLSTELTPQLKARLGATWTQARFEGGPNDGNQINGVPEQIATAGFNWRATPRFGLGLEASHVRRQFVDEANQVPIDEYTLVHLRANYRMKRWGLEVSARNLFDTEFVATGFLGPDDTGSFVPNLYPGSPRTIEARITLGY